MSVKLLLVFVAYSAVVFNALSNQNSFSTWLLVLTTLAWFVWALICAIYLTERRQVFWFVFLILFAMLFPFAVDAGNTLGQHYYNAFSEHKQSSVPERLKEFEKRIEEKSLKRRDISPFGCTLAISCFLLVGGSIVVAVAIIWQTDRVVILNESMNC